ncbi:MAG: RHS repeat-associated core domain-containing protein [Bacteroidetes bacterium]|nr:RHS repeat-associated core domain-containing protein [Bacteroidota bacterium]
MVLANQVLCIACSLKIYKQREKAYNGLILTSGDLGPDLSQSLQGAGGIGGLLGMIDSGADKQYVYCYDGNGNVGQVLDADDGGVGAHYEYDAFGTLSSFYGDLAEGNCFRFSTKYFDGEIGLYYYGFRYYSVDLGRWLNRDPIGEDGGFNLYAFAWNNGITFIDPVGKQNYGYGIGSGFGPPPTLPRILNDGWKQIKGASTTKVAGAVVGGAKTIVIATGVIIVFTGTAAVSWPVAITALGSIVVYSVLDTSMSRHSMGQNRSQVALGTIADLSGVNDIYIGVTNKDIATGENLNLSDFEQGERFGSGCVTAVIILSSSKKLFSNNSKTDIICRYPQKKGHTPGPHAAKTPGEHVWGGEHLKGSPYESWTSLETVSKDFSGRGTKLQSIDLNKVDPKRIAADLRTESGRKAAAARETKEYLKNVLLYNQDGEILLLRDN